MVRPRSRIAERIDGIDRSNLGTGAFGGSGLVTLLASVGGVCPFCVVGLPCPVCALGAALVVGGLFGGAGLSSFAGTDGDGTGGSGSCRSADECDCGCGD